MSRRNQRLDSSEDAAAYRVASLLRQQPPSASRNNNSSDTNSLRSMTSRIEQFLAMAPQVPAVRMEPELTPSGDNEEDENGLTAQLLRDGHPMVQLNVVAGVLEETDPVSMNGGMSSLGGVLLPTAANQQELNRRKVEQAQAMLNLMSALSPSAESGGAAATAPLSRGPALRGLNLSTRVLQHSSSSSSSHSDEEEVAVMNADDLNDEDTSDDDMPAQRRRIQEMN